MSTLDESVSVLRQRKLITQAKEKIDTASRLLRRKIPCTGHLMTPRKLWIQMVPTRECDMVILFPSGSSDALLLWLLERLKQSSSSLQVQVRHHSSSDSYGLYLTAPFKTLLKAAEEYHLPKALKPELGGGLKEFLLADISSFTDSSDESMFFTSQERQWLILRLVHNVRAIGGDEKTAPVNAGQAIVPKLLVAGLISQVFPLHDMPSLGNLQKSWVRAIFNSQPLDDICNYFGVKIAMYFAWLGYYTTSLLFPAVLGVVFSGELAISRVTGRLEPMYPNWKRNLFRYCISFPVIVCCLIVVFITMILMLQLQDWWDKILQSRNYPFFLSYFPKILFAIIITCFDDAYFKLACWLNDKENYRVDTMYENHLIVKVALFQFVNSFLSLFYIAFYLQDLDRLREQLAALLITRQVIGNIKESAIPYLLEQLRLAKLSFDMFGALSPSEAKADAPDWPSEVDESKTQTPSRKLPAGNRHVGQAELESTLFKYDGTFADHLEMLIQLGYVVLFSSAFPMAALCALVNNLIEIRSDAFKLCFILQRPFGTRVANIGSWQAAMEVMGLMAVLVNCALIGLSGPVHRIFPDMSATQTWLLIVALEHIVLTIRFLIIQSIPDLPDWVATEMAKVEFNRREAARRSSASSSNTSNTSPKHNLAEFIGRFSISPLPTNEDVANEFEECCAMPEQEPVETVNKSNSSSSTPSTSDLPINMSKPGTPATSKPSTPGTPTSAALKQFSIKTSITSITTAPVSSHSHETTVATSMSTSSSNGGSGGGPRLGSAFRQHPSTRNDWLDELQVGSNGQQHLTVGPHSHNADWVRRLALEKTRKTSEPSEVGSKSGGGASGMYRSTECLPKESSSSDSDLLRSPPPWVKSRFRFSPEPDPPAPLMLSAKTSTPSSGKTPSTSMGKSPAPTPTSEPDPQSLVKPQPTEEEIAAKKQRIKQSLVKRARSVAMFSLKLKEKRARDAASASSSSSAQQEKEKHIQKPQEVVGGELGLIPIEMLISVDDVAKDRQKKQLLSSSQHHHP